MPHTLIVGAGIAGLWIAVQRARAGDRVTVVEAYAKPGGRILTSRHGYELGAGRYHVSHRRIRALIRHYGLHERALSSEAPIWLPLGGKVARNYFLPLWGAVSGQLERLSADTLATHTIRSLIEQVAGPEEAEAIFTLYPYRTELDSLRADLGLHAMRNELGTNSGFRVVQEGLSAIIRGLVADLRAAGGTLLLNTRVTNVVRKRDGRMEVQLANQQPSLTADRVVLALHATALRALPVTRRLLDPALRHLDMAPLTRIYAKFPVPWVTGGTKIVTDSPLRYIIPIDPDHGLVMISYTDGRDTPRWRNLRGDALRDAVYAELTRLLGDQTPPQPRWVRAAEWTEGTTFWRPGRYDPEELSAAVLHPMPGLYCCGESFSVNRQAWMEGALEHAERLLPLLKVQGRSF